WYVGPSDLPATHARENVVGYAPCIGHDRQGRVLVSIRRKWRAVSDEEIGHVPGLTPFVGNGILRVCTHDCPADFVDDAAARGYRLGTVSLDRSAYAPPHRFDDVREGLLHVCRLAGLVLGPLPMEPQYRNTPFVLHQGVEL